jgi:hypothetical protein
MSTSIAIASSSNAMASAALIEAKNAKKTACVGLINNYKQTSNVVEMQAYAECVNIVYPDKQLDVYIGKTLLVSAFIFIIIGSMIGYKKHKDSFDMLEGGFAGLFVWVLCFLTLAAIGYLIYA